MTPDELHTLIHETETPFLIKTTSGRKYKITDRAQFWNPEPYMGLLAIVIPRKGLAMLRASSIESVHTERE